MKQFTKIILCTFLLVISANLHAVSIDKMIGEVDSINMNNIGASSNKTSLDVVKEVAISQATGCQCDAEIIRAKKEVIKEIENYTKKSMDSFSALFIQTKKNIKEIRNRTNNIEDKRYFKELQQKLKIATGTTKIKKHKLLGYKNILCFSKNGLVEKEDALKNIYSLMKSLELIENSLEINKGGSE